MRKILEGIAWVIIFLLVLDVVILLTSMSQIAIEGRTGSWSPFWKEQAEFVVHILT